MRYLLSALLSSSSSVQSTTTTTSTLSKAAWIKAATRTVNGVVVVAPKPTARSAKSSTTPSLHDTRVVTAAASWNNNGSSCGEDSAVVVQKRWGQQCGVSCGCVLRLEIELDDKERVVTALATTKRILVQANNSRKEGQQEPHTQLHPLLTLHRQRPQCTSPSPCRALQTLVSAVVQYMPGRYLWQLQNYHEYSSHMRSSGAFCRTVLDHMLSSAAAPCAPSLSQRPSNNNSPPPSNLSSTTMSLYTPCFDLVEDALTALLKGYIAAARRHPLPFTTTTTTFPTDGAPAAAHDTNCSTDNWLVTSYHFELDDKSKSDGSSSNELLGCIQAWWKRYRTFGWLFNTSDTETTTTTQHNKYPHHQPSFYTRGPRNHSSRALVQNHTAWHGNNYWTALDWMDWAEQERALSDQNQAKPSSRALFSDWISYVDIQEQNGRQSDRHEQQSA
jgi:hypothetical protein